MKKVLRQTGYVATLGISYLIRQNKKKKKSSVHSLDLSTATSSEMTSNDIINCPREEKIHQQTSQTDDAISGEPLTSYVSKEWHEKKMQDFVQLSTDEHHNFLQLVQQEIRIAETSREMAESNNSHLRSEILMLKNEISVLNDIHETEMAERNRAISDLYNEIATLRTDLASIDASPKKPRHVHL